MIMQLPHAQPPRRTLWSWLRDTVLTADRDAGAPLPHTTRPTVEMGVPQRALAGDGATILPFPIHGEALLVKLAAALRDRFGGREASLMLALDRGVHSRLTIDQAAYVEFHGVRGTYHAVIEAAADTTVMLDTTDFDTLVRFVMQYVTERPADTATLEAAS
ncbi:hypothetical protein [Bradyrhizobium sp. 2TAF24]|uniref:hypothetical protein n=1 Tax=Bradyrhizobium sp. 2TAF24 TaxID=3233011 RepID=UPI003F8E116B